MLGQRLRALRKKVGLTQKELALRAGLAQSTVALYESEARRPDLGTVMKLASALNTTVSYLLGEIDNPVRPRPSFLASPDVLGIRVRQFREARGWTQSDLAHASGVPLEVVESLEEGNATELAMLSKIARVLDLDTSIGSARGEQALRDVLHQAGDLTPDHVELLATLYKALAARNQTV